MSTTAELIKHAEAGDSVAMKDTLEAILARKAYDALETKRQEVAKNLVRSASTNNEE